MVTEVSADDICSEINNLLSLLVEICELFVAIWAIPEKRSSMHQRQWRKFWETTQVLTDEEFRLSFRMFRRDFKRLVQLVEGKLPNNPRMAGSRNGLVETEVRVAIVVRILSGSSYLDMILTWHISQPTIYRIFHETKGVLLQVLRFDVFPNNSTCRKNASEFSCSRTRINPLYGCVGALDGVTIRIRKPTSADCTDPEGNYHRKRYFSIPVQVICDANYRFVFFSAKCAGPTHDSVASSVSSYGVRIAEEVLAHGFWIAADEACVSSEHIITSVNAAQAPIESPEDSFNFLQSSHRMHVGQAFGMLMARWNILWRPLQFTLSENVRTVQLAIQLHNFCIESNDGLVEGLVSDEQYEEIRKFTGQLMNDGHRRNRESGSMLDRRKISIRSQVTNTAYKCFCGISFTSTHAFGADTASLSTFATVSHRFYRDCARRVCKEIGSFAWSSALQKTE